MGKLIPILFNTEMVKAIMDGRKTATRRLLKPQPEFFFGETGTPQQCDNGSWCFKIDQYENMYDFGFKPPCQPGDILYVRETWRVASKWGNICDRTFRQYLSAGAPMFSPDALKLGTDVLWWTPIPEDGWHDATVDKPPMETVVLTKDTYGGIWSNKWGFAVSFQREPEFYPCGANVRYWREIPTLPSGVELRRKK